MHQTFTTYQISSRLHVLAHAEHFTHLDQGIYMIWMRSDDVLT